MFDGIGIGGIERVGVDYVNLLTARGNRVSVINLSNKRTDLENEINTSCQIRRFMFSRNTVYFRYRKLIEYGLLGLCVYFIIILLLLPISFIQKSIFRLLNNDMGEADCAIAISGHYNDLYFVANNFIKSKHKIAWVHGAQFEYKMLSDGYFSLYKKVHNLVCLSEMCDALCEEFNSKYDIKKKKIYNPVLISNKKIDSAVVNDLKYRYEDFILMVGRMNKDKDQETAIRALKYVHEVYKKKHLVLVGDGPRRNELEKLTAALNLAEYVHFAGKRLDVQNFYEAAAVYVHSSPLEGLPTVILEAMNYGLPIVATDSIPGVREILGNDECGLISPIRDAKTLSTNIIRIYEDEALRNKLIGRGKVRIKEFTPEKTMSELEAFIGDLKG